MFAWINHLPAGWFIKLAILRLGTQWRSLLTLVAGVLLAAVIGASVPLYTAAIAQVGMVQRLERSPAAETNVFSRIGLDVGVDAGFVPTWEGYDTAVIATIDAAFAPFGDWLAASIRWGESANLTPMLAGEDIPDARMRLAYYEGLRDEVEIVAGVWPQEVAGLPDNADDIDVQVALPERVATLTGLAVGDTLVLDQRGWETSRLINAEVTAVIRERDADARYFFTPAPLQNAATAQWAIDANLFTTRASMERLNPAYLPQTRAQVGWRLVLDSERLNFDDSLAAGAMIDSLPGRIETALLAADPDAPTPVVNTGLAGILGDYQGEVDQLNVPFSLLLLQLGALVLFFLVVMGALVRRGERREMAMMQSRGAPDGQIILLRGVETFIIALAALLIAPLLAQQLLIVFIPTFTSINRLTLPLSRDAYLYAAGAVLVALVVLTATLVPLLRKPLISAGGIGERAGTQTWWQRYYIDVLLLVIGLVALWRLVSTDTLLVENAANDNVQADPLLLLAPTLLVFALGSVTLRFFPLIMDAISRAFSGGRRAVELTLSGWQVSREPLHYGRITFLLALAISIGWFAISFQTTVTGSQSDQAGYAAGADMRLRYGGDDDEAAPAVDAFRTVEGVEQAARVTRLENVPMSLGLGLDEGTILAVDSATFADAAYWRDDLGRLRVTPDGVAIQDTAITFPLPPDTSELLIDLMYVGVADESLGTVEQRLAVKPQVLAAGNIAVFAQILLPDGTLQLVPLQATPDVLAERVEARMIEAGLEPTDSLAGNLELINSNTNQLLNAVDLMGEVEDIVNDVYPEGWVPLRASVAGLGDDLRLMGLSMTTTLRGGLFGFSQVNTASLLVIGDTFVRDEAGAIFPQDWATAQDWGLIPEPGTVASQELPVPDNLPAAVLDGVYPVLAWSQNSERGGLTLAPGVDTVAAGGSRVVGALPALVSQSFMDLNELEIGQQFDLFFDNTTIWFEVADIVDYYPTLYDAVAPFIVVEQAPFFREVSTNPRATVQPNEIWLKLDGGVDPQAVVTALGEGQNVEAITDIVRRDRARATLETDPLAVGLIGLLFFSFLVGVVLSVVSLLTYATLTVQARQGELSVLRAIGLSPGRITSSIAIEQGLVLVVAVGLGMLIGFFLSTQVLPTLSRNTAGADVTPPFLIALDPQVLAGYLLAVVLILLVALAASALLVRRLTNAQALRSIGV